MPGQDRQTMTGGDKGVRSQNNNRSRQKADARLRGAASGELKLSSVGCTG